MELDALLARGGLDPATRLLALAGVAIVRADWPQLRRCASKAATMMPRADFEELLLQSVLFCGFPRAITAFDEVAAVWPPATPPSGGALPDGEQAVAGRALFATIYGRNDDAVRSMLRGHHGELHDFVLEAAYGRILCRPQLSPRRRELIAVAMLAAQGQPRQFVGHARGAIHLGASREELLEVVDSVFSDDPAGNEWRRRLA